MAATRPHLEFSARVASTEWARIAASGTWDDVDVDLFKLAALDKFLEV